MGPSEVGRDSDSDDDTLVLSGFTAGAFFAERYRLEKLLGAGSMGKVFRALDIASDVPVAIKVLHPDKARKPHVIERFRREAEILQGLGHPGIVRVLLQGRSSDGIEFLAMELLEGRTLKERLRGDGPLSPAELSPILATVCDALAAAHQQGVVHRDLKPDNVFLVEREDPLRVKVVDFGLSRLLSNERITKTGMMIGTPRYMAPEQIRSAKDADYRTDIYACGVMIHECLTGSSPFPAEDAGQLLGCVMSGRILQLEEQRPDLPASLGPVVRRAMATDPAHRYETIGAFAEAFTSAIGGATERGSRPGGAASGAGGGGAAFELGGEDAGSELGGSPRFTAPPSPPTEVRRKTAEAPPTPKKKSRRALVVALFVAALLVVACVATGAAFGLRRVLSLIELGG